MKKLMFATALAASAAAFADPTALNANGFEGYTADTGVTVGDAADPGGGNMYFLYQGDSDGSTVKAFGVGDNLAAPNITRPFYFQGVTPNANYLELSTEGGTLWRSINTLETDGPEGGATTNILGTAQAVAAAGTYLDTLVQFTPTEGDGAPELDDEADKLAIWLNVDSNGVTNLMVRAAVVNIDGEPTATTFTITNKAVNAGTWYRLTVKAIPDISDGDEIPGFQIRLDGDVLMSDTPTLDSEYLEVKGDSEYGEELKNGALFASLLGTASSPTLQGVGFKGSGALDDIVWTTEDPFANAGGDAAWIDEVTEVFVGANLSQAEKAAIASWASGNSITVASGSEEVAAAAYLLGLTSLPTAIPELTITSIEEGESAWTLTVAASVGDSALALPETINGAVMLTQSATLAGLSSASPATATFSIANGTATVTVAKDAATAKFMKVGVGIAPPANANGQE